MNKPLVAKVDLHCHSWASDRPSLWLMQRLGCPESFVSPEHVREAAMQRGMDFFTLSDHNTINGAREIAHYGNVFLSEEATTYFPDGVKVHVLCWGITEKQHEEISKAREDIYEFIQYLNENHILHACAHPLHKINGRTTWDHFEKMILLFKRHEGLNGSRLRRLNWITEQVLTHLKPEDIERLENKHGIAAVGERPWEKYLIAGSDDHSGLFVGTCYTEVEVGAMTLPALLEGMRRNQLRPRGSSDGCLTLAHQVNSIAYQYYKSKIGQDSSEMLLILGRIFERNRPLKIRSKYFVTKRLKKILNYFRKPKGTNVNLIEEVREVMRNNESFRTLFEEGHLTREEYNHRVFSLASEVLDQMIIRVVQKPKLLHYFILFAPTVMSSYLMTIKNIHAERDLIQTGEKWLGRKREPKVAWFTDSFCNMDGVSKTCRVFLEAAQKRNKNLTVITSHASDLSEFDTVANFLPVQQFPTPGYEKVVLSVPSILKVIKYVEDQEFDSIVVSTPGPVGIIGVLCAKLMRIPLHGIYHTDLPRIALNVSGDPMFAELALLMTRMFYRHADQVFSPSRWYIEDVVNLGIPEECTGIMERWVDTTMFSPVRKDPDYWKAKESCRLLYVGRISKDKNIDVLIKLYEKLAPKYDHFVIHCVGDGPYFDEMKRKTASLARFYMTGAKFGDDLAKAYASSDVFVYPGLLDTFGNVVIEAQASGLPCVVMNEGGPHELIQPEKTGFVARSTEEFIDRTEQLMTNDTLREQMGLQAAEYAKQRFSEEKVFNDFWNRIIQPVVNHNHKKSFNFDTTDLKERVKEMMVSN